MTIKLSGKTSTIEAIDENGKLVEIKVDTTELLKVLFANPTCHLCDLPEAECECEDDTWVW